MLFGFPKEFDRNFRGENFKISPLNLQNLSPKFSVKLQSFFNLLIINTLQNGRFFRHFVKYFYQFYPTSLPAFFHKIDAVGADLRSRSFQASG
jgi:hypothetical protein